KDSPDSEPHVDYLRLLQRAIKKRDGPMFMKVMSAINALLSLLKYPPLPLDPFDAPAANHLGVTVRGWQRIPTNVVHRIADETYQRAVGPHIDVLKRYEAFSSEVYGELMPTFVSDVIRATGLHGGSLFLDMGSGVGNVVMQASLETGCRSYGIEIMPGPAQIARSQLEQFKTRCRMWGVRMGEVELEEGDMLKSAKVDELVKSADVVLVNNKVFLEPHHTAQSQSLIGSSGSSKPSKPPATTNSLQTPEPFSWTQQSPSFHIVIGRKPTGPMDSESATSSPIHAALFGPFRS
ncbi:S-adenosyl-L-methionine-dependent methyltransferase, partial [Dichomitus squalens LYAD-421 SS1]